MLISTIIILVVTAAFFVAGKMRSDLVALCSLLALLIFQILTPEEALSGFSNSVVIMMVGLFVVGGAIVQTGLAKMISRKVMKLAGTSELRLFLLVMLVTAVIGAFVSNTGTVALMLPIVVSMAVNAGGSPRRLLMPLAFASSMGGMMTLIGTPPNLIIQDTLVQAGYPALSFFSFLPVGLVCLAVGILVLLPMSRWFLSPKKGVDEKQEQGKTLKQLVKEYGLTNNLFRLKLSVGCKAIGKTVIDLDVNRQYGINILEIRRDNGSQHRFLRTVSQQVASAEAQLEADDVLYVSGSIDQVQQLATDFDFQMMDTRFLETGKNNELTKNNETSGNDSNKNNLGSSVYSKSKSKISNPSLDFYDIGIAEVLLMPSASIVGKKVMEAGLRAKFNVNVLGIRRKNDYLLQDIGKEKLHSGDVMLVQGDWKDIARLEKEDTEWVVLGQPQKQAEQVTLDYKAPMAGAIMVLMVVLMVFDRIPVAPVTAVMIAGVLMVLTGCFRSVEAAYKTINWEAIVLFAAMLPMSHALEKTGASAWLSDALVQTMGGSGPILMLAGIYFTTSLMTMFISNTVTAVLMAPIALHSALQIGVSPVPYLFAVTVAASMCFASPFSTPPNALVMPAGGYSFMDYIKVGLPLQIIMGLVMVAVLPLLFPF